jgi:hypothetical protein
MAGLPFLLIWGGKGPIVVWGVVMNRIAAVTLLALTPALAHADSVFLTNGGEIRGEIVEQREDGIVIEVGPGRVTVPRKNVARVVSSTTDLGVYHARAAALSPRDVAGWVNLAEWARAHDLGTQARDAFNRVLAVDPENAAAHLALGHVQIAGRWMDASDANRAQGLVEFEGTWMSAEERRDRIEDRRASDDDRRAAREAEVRVREAEARAREAEARARTAEADAQAASQPVDSGIPYPYVFQPGPYGGYPPPVIVPVDPVPPPPPPPPVRRAPVKRGGLVTEPRKSH